MGKSSAPQQTVQKTELPPWLNEAAQKNLEIADQLASRPYQPYGGSVVAGFSPEQQQAFQMAQRRNRERIFIPARGFFLGYAIEKQHVAFLVSHPSCSPTLRSVASSRRYAQSNCV